jgi:hypothetical protein
MSAESKKNDLQSMPEHLGPIAGRRSATRAGPTPPALPLNQDW